MFAVNRRSLLCESFILERHSGGVRERGYLHSGRLPLISLTGAQVSPPEDQLWCSDCGAFVLTAAFIYSLTGGSEKSFHLFHLPSFEMKTVWNPICFSRIHTHEHTQTHRPTNPASTSYSWMSESVMTVKAEGKNEGWGRGLLGPWEGRSFIDCFSKWILRLLVVLLNKSSCWKKRDHISRSPPWRPPVS